MGRGERSPCSLPGDAPDDDDDDDDDDGDADDAWKRLICLIGEATSIFKFAYSPCRTTGIFKF